VSSFRISRKKRFSGNNWMQKHSTYIHEWEHRPRMEPTNGARCTAAEFREYLQYLHRSTRIRVHPTLTSAPIDEGDSDEDDPYDIVTRQGVFPERAPLQNYMVHISNSNHVQNTFGITTLCYCIANHGIVECRQLS
jgi:hypothetical protein